MNTTEGLDVHERFKLWLEWYDLGKKLEFKLHGATAWRESTSSAFDIQCDYRLAEPEKPRVHDYDTGRELYKVIELTATPYIVQAGREPIRLEDGWVVLRRMPMGDEIFRAKEKKGNSLYNIIQCVKSLRVNFDAPPEEDSHD